MSIYTLQQKSRRYKAPISGIGKDGFSLNGGYRNIGSVGSSNLAKSVSRTRFRGTEPMGHGGHYGAYPIYISNSGSCSTNDNSIAKNSVITTKGSIIHKNKWIHSAYPNFWTKNDSSSNANFSQSEYIKNVIAKSGTCITSKPDSGIDTCGGDKNCKAASYYIGTKKHYRAIYSKNLNIYPTSSSQYQSTKLLKTNNLPTPPCLKPFPFVLNNKNSGSSGIIYLNPQQAINDGILPNDWMNCTKC
jgi:hypothetical protein